MTALPQIPDRIRKLTPYVCARHMYKGDSWIFLDANESPFTIDISSSLSASCNRYPDPTADTLRDTIASYYAVHRDKLILGNGTDELIDLTIRTFVRPGCSILSLSPTYGMYRVCADICGIPYTNVPLTDTFEIDEDALRQQYASSDILFLCNPNNPTGTIIPSDIIEKIVSDFNGLVFVDEAYGEFTDASGIPSSIELIKQGAKNLIVTRTFSKAFGAAGIRLGYAIADTIIIEQLMKVKPPYNVNCMTQQAGVFLWESRSDMEKNVRLLLNEKNKLSAACTTLGCTVFPSEANFLLIRLPDSITGDYVYNQLKDEYQIIVRYFGSKPMLSNCLRVSIGTRKENNRLCQALSQILT